VLVFYSIYPEYPCAHCVVAATVGTILKFAAGSKVLPVLSTSSTTANGAMRSWSSIENFVQEVFDAHIYDGVHYRISTEVGTAMGNKIANLALKHCLP
jgi:hypothetical protein